MRSFLIIAIFSFSASALGLPGQKDNESEKKAGNFYLSFRNINFLKNNEYSNPVIEGYTLGGYFIQPEVVYVPSGKITLNLGAHLVSYLGTNKYSLAKPLFSLVYKFSEKCSFTIGSLSGSDTHMMFDPHFNKERLYNEYSEDGIQFRFIDDHLFSDSWLNWENYIFRGDSAREVFTVGESFRYTSSLISDLFRFEIPVQMMIRHLGGQISDYTEPVETFLNIATGAKIGIDIRNKKGAAGFEYLLFIGKELRDKATTGISYGHGEWYKFFLMYKTGKLEIGFWESHDFFAPCGNFIFGSVSDHINNFTVPGRNILTGSLSVGMMTEGFLELYLGLDGYYDTDLRRFDNAITLHLKFNRIIKLASHGNQ